MSSAFAVAVVKIPLCGGREGETGTNLDLGGSVEVGIGKLFALSETVKVISTRIAVLVCAEEGLGTYVDSIILKRPTLERKSPACALSQFSGGRKRYRDCLTFEL